VRFEKEDADWVKAQSPLVKRVTRGDGALEGTYARRAGFGHRLFAASIPIWRNAHEFHGRRWISPEDIEERRRVAFLGAILRRKLFKRYRAIGRNRAHRRCQFTVVGSMDRNFPTAIISSDDESVSFRTRRRADLWDARYASVMLFEPSRKF